jgi:general secretion pathway protein H
MSPIGSRRRAPAGFTLIELLVVLGVLALAMALALPLLPGAADRAALRAAASEIASGLRETRGLALARGRSATFTIDTERRAFRIGDSRTWHALPANVAPVLFTATREQLAETVGDIRFFSDGSSTGGEVQLLRGKAEDDIRVDWLTGRVSSGAAAPQRAGVLAH